MGRKRKRRVVYFNNNTDTTTNDSHEQVYLTPTGQSTDSLESKQAVVDSEKSDIEYQDALAEHNTELITEQDSNDVKENEYNYDTGRRKYRRYMSKDVDTKKLQKIASDALDRHVSRNDFQDELHDDGISKKEYPKESLSDYRNELAKKEIPVKDKDYDGDIDKDDVDVTPSMSKMSRYIQ